MGNENSDAQNNQKCNYGSKHRQVPRNGSIERSAFCTVKEIPPGDETSLRMMISSNIRLVEIGLKAKAK